MNNNLTLSVTLTGDGRQLTGTLRNAQGEVREFGDVSVRDNARATGAFDRTGRSVGTVNNQLNEMNHVGRAARNTLLALGGAISVREVIGYSDAWRNAENQLRQVTSTSAELAATQSALVDIALDTRSNFDASANLYARLARATTELNLTQQELLGLTTTINKSFATNGATAQEAAAAITQLSQGLAAGALRGDEFNSVSEQAPGIMRAIADSLNMTIGELREFAAQGGITAEIVVNALQRASDTIDQDFGKTIATFGQNMEIARTELVRWVGTSNEVSTAVDTFGGGIVTVTEHLDQLVTVAQVGVVLLAGRYAGALATATTAMAAKTTAAIADMRQTALADAQEQGRIATIARRTAAEQSAAASTAQLAAQRAAADRAAIAQDAQRLASTQAALAAERALETQRLQAQISATGRMLSHTRLAEIRASETAITNQLTAANARLTQAEASEASAKRLATAASVEKARADTVATAAMGRYTAAASTAAGANTAFAATSRAAAGALALVGGPLGAAVIAGAALYYFRDELGLTDDKMKGTIDTVEDLGETFVDEFSNLGTSVMGGVRGARAELIELDAGFLDLKAGALESFSDIVAGSSDLINMGLIPIQHALNALDQGFADWINRFANAFESAGAMPFGMANLFGEQVTRMRNMADGLAEGMIEPIGISTAALEGNAQAWRDQAEAMRGTADEVRSGTNPATQETVAIFKTLDEWLFKTTKTTGDSTGANSKNAASQRELAAATQAQADALEELYNRLRPGRREVVQLADDMRTLTLAIAMGTGNIAENIQMMGLLQQQFIEAQNDTDDLAKKTVDAAFTMEGAWDEVRLNGLRRLDDGFADLWEGAIDGSLNAGKLMKRALAQTISEMAHMAFTRPITVQMATSMGFGGTGVSGQQAAGGGMPSFSGMMDGSGAIANAYRAFQGTGSTYAGTFGSELAVQTQGGLKAGFESFANSGFGNTALGLGGGFIGSKLGSSVFGESKEQQIGAAAGGVAGQVLIPIPGVGAGIGSFLGSGLGSLFGSSPKKFSGRFGTTASLDRSEGAGKDGVFEHQAGGRFYRETALGYAGFRDQGTERLQRAGVGEDKQWAEDLVNATAAMDALTVSVARSDEEIATMRDTVQGLEASGRNAGEIIEFALKGRALAALESIGHTFSDAVSSLPADEFTARLEIMAGGMGVLMQTADRLNLQFDATAAGALEAAGNLAQIAGGVENLAAINQGYYEATYTETERLSRSQAELRESLASVTNQVPTTVGELRAMVEAQNLNDAAAGELAVRLMELAPALKQTNDAVRDAIEQQYQESLGRAPDASGMDYWFNQIATGSATLERALAAIAGSSEAAERAANGAASGIDTMADALRERESLERQLLQAQGNTDELRRRELEATDPSNRALQQRIWYINDERDVIAQAQRQQQERNRAIDQEASAMARARDQLASFGVGITGYIDNLRGTEAGLGSPADQLAASSQAFYEQYDKAAAGDRDALNSITQYADRFITAQQGWSASGAQTTATIDKVVGMLGQLPDKLSAEQFLANEIRDALGKQTTDLLNGHETITGRLANDFQGIDLSGEGLIDWSEFRTAFAHVADEATLRKVFDALDNNGSGAIDKLEAISLGTQSLVSYWANQQPANVQDAISKISDMYETALNREPDLPGLQYWIDEWLSGASLKTISESIQQHIGKDGGATTGGNSSGNTGGSISAADKWLATQNSQVQSWGSALDNIYQSSHGREATVNDLKYWTGQLKTGASLSTADDYIRAAAYVNRYADIRKAWTTEQAAWKARSGASNLQEFGLWHAKNLGIKSGREFANGGWTGPGGKWDEAGVVHAEEFVVRREVVKQPGVREMLEGLNREGVRKPTYTPPAMPVFSQDNKQNWVRELLNENIKLRADINKLMSDSNKHLAAANNQRGAAAKGQIGAIERGNKMLKKMEDDKRLEAAKR